MNKTTTTATITRIGQLQPSKYAHQGKPDRAPVDFLTSDGRSLSEWFEAPAVTGLAPGATVTLIMDGKKITIADVRPAAAVPFPAAAPAPPPSQVPNFQGKMFEVPSKEVRENILKYVEWETNLYRHCYEEVLAVMGESKDGKRKDLALDKYNIKDIATTVFLSVQRRYNLQ